MIVEDFTWSPKNPQIGDAVEFTAIIKNIGGTASPNGQKHGIAFLIHSGLGTSEEYFYTATWNDQHFSSIPGCGSVELTATGGRTDAPASNYIVNGNAWAPHANGTFQVIAWVADNGGVATLETKRDNNQLIKNVEVGVTTGNLASEATGISITAYSNIVRIDGIATGEIITIYNLLGKKIYSREAAKNPEFINSLNEGMYIVVIENANVTKKVLLVK